MKGKSRFRRGVTRCSVASVADRTRLVPRASLALQSVGLKVSSSGSSHAPPLSREATDDDLLLPLPVATDEVDEERCCCRCSVPFFCFDRIACNAAWVAAREDVQRPVPGSTLPRVADEGVATLVTGGMTGDAHEVSSWALLLIVSIRSMDGSIDGTARLVPQDHSVPLRRS